MSNWWIKEKNETSSRFHCINNWFENENGTYDGELNSK